jgi:hypothetical protein
MNRAVGLIILSLYLVLYGVICIGFWNASNDGPGGVDQSYHFGKYLAPLPAILMTCMYALFLTNFALFLVNTIIAIRVQFITFIVMFFTYAFLMLFSNI